MRSQDPTEYGVVLEALPGLQFKVELHDGKTIRCYLAGKMKMNYIRVLAGDRVQVIVSGELGRITRRL